MDVIGKEFVLRGRVRKNQFTERMEFVVNEVERMDVEKEIKNLLERIKD